jgi:hypothetical protein
MPKALSRVVSEKGEHLKICSIQPVIYLFFCCYYFASLSLNPTIVVFAAG